MQLPRSRGTGGQRRSTDHLGAWAVVALAALVAVSACAGAEPGMPEPALSADQLQAMEERAQDVARQRSAWPDVEAVTADYAEDFLFADVSAGDVRTGRSAVVQMLGMWAAVTDYEAEVTGVFASPDGVACQEDWPGLDGVPPGAAPWRTEVEPPELQSGLGVVRFGDSHLVESNLWRSAEDMHGFGIGCFAVDGCPDLPATIDAYVAAWSGRDGEAIGRLYHDEARFTDSVLGLSASGDEAIAGLADQRFGPAGEVAIEVLDRYVWTDGGGQPTQETPDRGQLVGVAIHHEARVAGATETQQALTTLQLCAWEDNRCEPDPDGLIHREDVYHWIGSLDS